MLNSDKATREMQLALGHYCDATIVTDWGMQEVSDNGAVARKALGFEDHEPDCSWPNGGNGEFYTGTECTCGLQEHIDQVLSEIMAVDAVERTQDE